MVGFLRRYKETCRNPQKYIFPVHLAEGVVNQYFMLRSNKFNPKVSVSDATPAIYIGSSMILKTCNSEHFSSILYIYLQLTQGRTFADEHQHLTDLLCLFPVKDWNRLPYNQCCHQALRMMDSPLCWPQKNRTGKVQSGRAIREDSTGHGIIHKIQHKKTPDD